MGRLRLLCESEQQTMPSTTDLQGNILKEGCVKISGSRILSIKSRRVLVLTDELLRW
jgi:hypothetical protein